MSTALVSTQVDFSALLPAVRDSVVSPATKRAYYTAIAGFIAWNQGYELERTRVLAYRQHLLDAGKSTSTVNLALSAIRKLVEEAEAQDLLSGRVATRIRSIPGLSSRGRRFGNWLTRDQARQILALPDQNRPSGLRDYVLLGLLLGCGLRRQEVRNLRIEQVVRRDGRMILLDVEGKGRKLRTVVVPRFLEEPLDLWILLTEASSGPLIRRVGQLQQIRDKGMSADRVAAIVIRYAKAIGLKISPHDLRRTFALQSMEGGANPEAVRQALGHESLDTTTKYVASALVLKNPACDFLKL